MELVSYLNENEEVAFIVSAGPGKWIAVPRIETLKPGSYCLWHIPSGPLPLLKASTEEDGEIGNPFDAWTEIRPGTDTSVPYFGPGHPGVIWITIRSTQTDTRSQIQTIGLSTFQWIGNHYRMIGIAPLDTTEKFWKTLSRWVKKQTRKVPRGGLSQSTRPEIWAFPEAFEMLNSGAEGAMNP
ncbi:hypothetical protein [Herbaspirillum sp. NPDC101396]|uniref:hypothetical protein n=1 Tax=Herbaspirillum sp. NPDC101396 TaxID=3364005 RepID=UPI00383BD4FE